MSVVYSSVLLSGFYQQLFDYAEENRDYGMFRVWLGVQPLVGIFKPEFVEVRYRARD